MHEVTQPEQAVWSIGNGRAVLLGDALAPVHPSTRRGLNNGIMQAKSLADHLSLGTDTALRSWEERTLQDIVHWIGVGRKRARAYGVSTRES